MIALWFACQGDESQEEDGKVIALELTGTTKIANPNEMRDKLPSDSPDTVLASILGAEKLWVWEALRLNERISAQKSVFVFGGKVFPQEIPTAIVSKNAKQEILRDLDKMFGLSSESLFPDLPGFAQLNAHDKANPVGIAFYMDQAFGYFVGGEHQRAIETYTRALDMNPTDALASVAYVNRGVAKGFFTMDLHGAIEDLSAAICLVPETFSAYGLRGEVRLRAGDFTGAMADLEEAIKRNPDNLSYSHIVHRGDARKGTGDLCGAIADYTLAIKQTEGGVTDLGAHRQRGSAKAEAGDIDGALADFDRAISIRPQDIDAYYGRGKLRERVGDGEGAKPITRKSQSRQSLVTLSNVFV